MRSFQKYLNKENLELTKQAWSFTAIPAKILYPKENICGAAVIILLKIWQGFHLICSFRNLKYSTMNITLKQAQTAIEAAQKKSEDLGVKMNIAVVDSGANLTAFARMENAWLGSIDIAIKKAKTARFFDMETGEVGKLSQPGESLFNIEHSNNGLITFPGGVPVKNENGEIIGAVGVSGSSVENDHEVASYAVNAI